MVSNRLGELRVLWMEYSLTVSQDSIELAQQAIEPMSQSGGPSEESQKLLRVSQAGFKRKDIRCRQLDTEPREDSEDYLSSPKN